MTTRRRALLGVAASIGAIGSAGGLATATSAAPDSSPARIEAAIPDQTLDALRAEIEQLQAELEDEKALTAGLERINHHLWLEFDRVRPLRRRWQYHCSFCSKRQDQVRRLITGPGAVDICDECVDLCREIIAEESTPLDSAYSGTDSAALTTPRSV